MPQPYDLSRAVIEDGVARHLMEMASERMGFGGDPVPFARVYLASLWR